MEDTHHFVHVLLFECNQCGSPISVAVGRHERNSEEIDGQSFQARCRCGWSGTLIGTAARRHWVEAWDRGMVGKNSE